MKYGKQKLKSIPEKEHRKKTKYMQYKENTKRKIIKQVLIGQ